MNEKNCVKVKDVMKESFDLVDGMETVANVLKNAKHPESKLFIIDKRHEGDEFGIVMLSDIAKKVLAKNKSPERVNIYEIMSKPILSVDKDMDIKYCTRFLESFGMTRVPVTDNKKVVGVIGYTDIVLQGIRDKL